MIVNINARVLTNGAIFVQYQEGSKAKDAAFLTWEEYVTWVKQKTYPEVASIGLT